jgi:hypothetical protein
MDLVVPESRTLFEPPPRRAIQRRDGHLFVNLARNDYLSIEFTEQIELSGTRDGDEGRGIGDDSHELKRSNVRRSSSRSEGL